MKYKHIVFDIDGTLIDTEYAVLHSLQETIKGLSGEIPCSELRFCVTQDYRNRPLKKACDKRLLPMR
ncbi:MAG: HAD family hydrolase [Blautia faecis]